jgi:hypothetical protein
MSKVNSALAEKNIADNRIRGLICVLAIFCCLLSIKVWISSYQEMLELLKPQNFQTLYEKENYEKGFFSPERYQFLKIFCGFFIPLTLILAYLGIRESKKISMSVGDFIAGVKSRIHKLLVDFNSLKPSQKILFYLFVVLAMTVKIWVIFSTGLHDDEIWSYRYFIKEGVLVTGTYYPDTNNHILFNLFGALLYKINDNYFFVMKLPVLIQSTLLLILLFLLLNSMLNYRIAIISVSLTAFTGDAVYYSAIGRGHFLMSLFAIISLVSVFRYLQNPQKFYLWLFTCCSILGFYTVPTYLYFFTSIGLYLFLDILINKRLKLIKPVFIALLSVCIGVLICYLPVILVSGHQALLGNKWVNAGSSAGFFSACLVYIAEWMEYMTGLLPIGQKKYLIAGVLYILFLVFFIKTKNQEYKKWILWIFVAFAGIMATSLFLKVLAPYRVFIFYIVTLHVGIAILLYRAVEIMELKFRIRSLFLVLLVLILLGGMINNYRTGSVSFEFRNEYRGIE